MLTFILFYIKNLLQLFNFKMYLKIFKILFHYCKNNVRYYKLFYNNDPYGWIAKCNLVFNIKEHIYLSLIMIVLLIMNFNNITLAIFEKETLFSQLLFPLIMPLNLRLILQKYADFRQNLINKIILKLLDTPYINFIIRLLHRFLFAFRIYSVIIGDKISCYISLNMFALIISIIMSRLHFAGYLIIFCLLFLRLDFAVLSIARFYKKYPERLQSLYPEQKRYMWSRATKIAEEAASNPQVQTVAVAVTGALAWKALDVYDTYKEAFMQDKDIAAENERNNKNIAAENVRNNKNIVAENQRHQEEIAMRRAELLHENRRHAEEIAMRQKELEHQKNAN